MKTLTALTTIELKALYLNIEAEVLSRDDAFVSSAHPLLNMELDSLDDIYLDRQLDMDCDALAGVLGLPVFFAYCPSEDTLTVADIEKAEAYVMEARKISPFYHGLQRLQNLLENAKAERSNRTEPMTLEAYFPNTVEAVDDYLCSICQDEQDALEDFDHAFQESLDFQDIEEAPSSLIADYIVKSVSETNAEWHAAQL